MINKLIYTTTIILFIIICEADCYSQNNDIIDSFNKINAILSEYVIDVPETEYETKKEVGARDLIVKDLKLSYQYPNVVISYNIKYAPNIIMMVDHTPGKRIISFPLSETDLIFYEDIVSKTNPNLYSYKPEYKQLKLSCKSGIEKTEFGKKTIIRDWFFQGSSLLMKKLYTEFVTFKRLSQDYKGSLGEKNSNTAPTSSKSSMNKPSRKIIQMERRSDNTFRIPCKVNGLPLKFIFDTGASSVSLSLTEANFMIKQGLITQKDIVGSSYYSIADGSIAEGTIIILRKIEIGGMLLKDVRASVIHTQNAPLLLGQNVISRLGKVEIDYSNSTLTILH